MKFRHPNNAKGKPRHRNDGSLHRGSSFSQGYGMRASILTTHRRLARATDRHISRIRDGRYCWSTRMRRLVGLIKDSGMDTDMITVDSQGNASTFPDADLTHALYMLELQKPLPLDLAARLLERGLDVSTIERNYA